LYQEVASGPTRKAEIRGGSLAAARAPAYFIVLTALAERATATILSRDPTASRSAD
jgi:hypothetical protein